MAVAADFGLMIWDGKSPGTVLNVLRLLRAGKAAVLIHGSAASFTLKSTQDWDAFLAGCSDGFELLLRALGFFFRLLDLLFLRARCSLTAL